LNPGFDLLIAANWERLLAIDGQPLPIVSTRKNAANNAGDGAARDGAARDGAARNGAARDGAARDGAAGSLDGGSQREPELVPIPAGNGAGELNRDATATEGLAANEPPVPRLLIGKLTLSLVLLGIGGVGLLFALLVRSVRSQQAASRCRES
jgi:hypothetical protein